MRPDPDSEDAGERSPEESLRQHLRARLGDEDADDEVARVTGRCAGGSGEALDDPDAGEGNEDGTEPGDGAADDEGEGDAGT